MTSTPSQLLFVYLLGGLTFIPICLALAWYALPKLEEGAVRKDEGLQDITAEDGKTKETLKQKEEELYAGEEEDAASGTFAVLRKYDPVAAYTALAARSGGSHAAGTGTGMDGAADGGTGSESVYQSMYRSVFDRSRTSTPPNDVLKAVDDENANFSDPKHRKKVAKPAPANTFYIVLRHGHLMLYDSPAQIEVRHVISLAHHRVSLSEGPADDYDVMTDGDLFIKRTAILLSPLPSIANGVLQSQALAPKPFYLFAPTSIQKESFYHALLLAGRSPPTPQPLSPHDLIKLQTTLHSTIITAETRALNAVISRVFLALSGTDQLKDFFRAKIEKKIARVQKPGFINTLALHTLDLGTAAPVIANLRLKDLNVSGDTTVSCDVRYTGGISLAFAAQARLDLGPRFKARTVDLLLSSSLKRLSGHVHVRIKPPPSNRIWFCFASMPDMEIKIEPVVSSRQITYGFILRQIEERIRGVVAETLVKPNWDDIPFFDTRDQKVRGGMWAKEDYEDGKEKAQSEADILARSAEKTMSMPVLQRTDSDADAISSGASTPRRDAEAELKRRSVVSLPPQSASTSRLATIESEEREPSPAQPTRPLRSPSFTSPSASAPSVALDDSSANFDPSHKHTPPKARAWGRRPAPAPPPAVDAVRSVRDRNTHTRDPSNTSTNSDPTTDRDLPIEEDTLPSPSIPTPDRSTTASTTSTTSSANTTETIPSLRQKRAANLLAAATTATTAAKDWGWKTLQSRTAGKSGASGGGGRRLTDPQEPIGRGQPLPPPGTPLPGPTSGGRSLWAGSGFGVPGLSGGGGSVRRKPVLPKRPSQMGAEGGVEKVERVVGDEFGDWKENSGGQAAERGDGTAAAAAGVGEELDGREKKVPPPLPKRRPKVSIGNEAPPIGATHESPASASASKTNADHPSTTSTLPGPIAAANPDQPYLPPSPSFATSRSALPRPSTTQTRTASSGRETMPTIPQRPSPDSEDLIVVPAPTESGRTTPVPSAGQSGGGGEVTGFASADGFAAATASRPKEGVARQDDSITAVQDRGRGDADGKGGGQGQSGLQATVEDEDEVVSDEEEGVPKASFSRSRGMEAELYHESD